MATKTNTTPTFFSDPEQMIALQQRNVDAMTTAGQVMVDGYKALALRQSEMIQSGFGSFANVGQKLVDGKTGEIKSSEQIAQARSTYETTLANARELTEIAVKAQHEAFDILSKCAIANFDDLKSLAKAA